MHTGRHPASNKINFQSPNPVNTQNYKPTQLQNDISLPCYLQQHEITKTQLKIFSKTPNAAESIQYIMGGSSIC